MIIIIICYFFYVYKTHFFISWDEQLVYFLVHPSDFTIFIFSNFRVETCAMMGRCCCCWLVLQNTKRNTETLDTHTHTHTRIKKYIYLGLVLLIMPKILLHSCWLLWQKKTCKNVYIYQIYRCTHTHKDYQSAIKMYIALTKHKPNNVYCLQIKSTKNIYSTSKAMPK